MARRAPLSCNCAGRGSPSAPRPGLHLGNFMRTLAMPKTVRPSSATSLPEKLIKIGAKVVSHGRCVTFQMVEVAVPRRMFRKIFVAYRPVAAPASPADGVRYGTQI